ncbi:DUF6187 family protein [Actinophytocola sp.]|uniref:DUF6187 family protein n=1 Tax=Actinophytocola sp. TaxID=1872138 RepID=UPI002D80AA08|nr:DUF6187 family protein [Actinophytocola sp.]HET9139101.1 DUF6187 family protein [Actinophytocola sp.]HEU5110104.1 DUF6187 family protein [Micromonosporaceae bacterium]
MTEPFDSRFTLPAVDDPAAVEVGVILLGLDGQRLLAGLGLATLADDPTSVALLVDRLRHGVGTGIDLSTALAAGTRRWHAVRAALTGTPGNTAAVRAAWVRACAVIDDAGLTGLGPASRAYLAACWLRQSEVDRYLEDPDDVPEVTA